MSCVFDFYEHPNGGCIFADPSVFEKVVTGGKQFFGALFTPITELIRQQIPVAEEVIDHVAETETEFIIDGTRYELVEKRSPAEIIRAAPDVDKLLDEAVEKLGITKRKAKQELYNEVIRNLKEVESIRDSVFNDDEEIIMILIATDDI